MMFAAELVLNLPQFVFQTQCGKCNQHMTEYMRYWCWCLYMKSSYLLPI